MTGSQNGPVGSTASDNLDGDFTTNVVEPRKEKVQLHPRIFVADRCKYLLRPSTMRSLSQPKRRGRLTCLNDEGPSAIRVLAS